MTFPQSESSPQAGTRLTPPEGTQPLKAGGVAADQLRSIVERIERMESEKAEIADAIKDLFAEAKGNGFDVKTLRRVIALRKLDAAKRDEADFLLDTYKRALGIGPLFDGDGR